MIRCAWCGAKNYAIDIWCTRCQHHLDWRPARGRSSAGPVRFLSAMAAAAGVALLVALPAAGWSSGELQLTIRGLPTTGALVRATPRTPAGLRKAPAKPTPSPARAPVAQAAPHVAATARPAVGVGSVPAPPAAPAGGDPVSAIQGFYRAVSAHQYDLAASFWSSSMKATYPPAVYIDTRFSATQQIGLTGDRVVAHQAGTALVYVEVLEVVSGGVQREWIGTWQLVQGSSGWLLNSPNLEGG